jgi:Zn-finger nucleic acid-binding protein
MKCPNCGANTDISATTCGYCSAELAVRACPCCFGKLFLGTKFCPQCGAKSDEPATALSDGNAAPRHCPRCRGGGQLRLESRLARNIMLDTCPECFGVFVDSDLLERILAELRYRSADSKAADARTDNTAPRPAAAQRGPFYVKCPDCDANMARRVFAERAGVIVDVCRNHGTWLDPDELDQLVAFVQRGGLDRSTAQTSFESSVLRQPAAAQQPVRRVPKRKKTKEASFFDDVVDVFQSLLN